MSKPTKSEVLKWLETNAEYYKLHPNEHVYGHTIVKMMKAVQEDFEHIWTIIYDGKIIEVQHRPNLDIPKPAPKGDGTK